MYRTRVSVAQTDDFMRNGNLPDFVGTAHTPGKNCIIPLWCVLWYGQTENYCEIPQEIEVTLVEM